MEINNFRKGNAELRVSHTIAFKNKPSEEYAEVVLWYPNCHYGKKKYYEKVKHNPGFYRKKSGEPWETNCFIHESCFKNPESCYTIITFERDARDVPDFTSVGNRLIELSPKDLTDVLDCVREFYKQYFNSEED